MIGRRIGIPGIAPAVWTPARLGSSLALWLRADMGITLNGSDVSAWADQSGAGQNVTQASGAIQPAYVSAGGVFGTLPHIAYTTANNDHLSAATAAYWKFLHDGTGMAIALRYRATAAGTYFILDTCNAGPANHGITITHDGANQRAQLVIANGSGAYVANVLTNNGTLTNNAVHTLIACWKHGAATEVEVFIDGVSSVTASAAASPSTSNPSYALGIGRRASATNALQGEIGGVIAMRALPTASEIAAITAYMARAA